MAKSVLEKVRILERERLRLGSLLGRYVAGLLGRCVKVLLFISFWACASRTYSQEERSEDWIIDQSYGCWGLVVAFYFPLSLFALLSTEA